MLDLPGYDPSLAYRIKVKGSVQHLQEAKNADLVRTLLQ